MFYPNRFLWAFTINQNHMIKSLWTIKAFWGMLLRDCPGAADGLIVWPAVDSGAACNRGGSSSDKCPHSNTLSQKILLQRSSPNNKVCVQSLSRDVDFFYIHIWRKMFREFKNIWGKNALVVIRLILVLTWGDERLCMLWRALFFTLHQCWWTSNDSLPRCGS